MKLLNYNFYKATSRGYFVIIPFKSTTLCNIAKICFFDMCQEAFMEEEKKLFFGSTT